MPKAKWTGEGTVSTTCRACVNGYQNRRKGDKKINVANVKEAGDGHDRPHIDGKWHREGVNSDSRQSCRNRSFESRNILGMFGDKFC